MKKIDWRTIITFLLGMIVILALKRIYVLRFYEGDALQYVGRILGVTTDNSIVNIIWILPILLNIFLVGNHFYLKTLYFETRYQNRKKYIKKTIRDLLFISLSFNIIVAGIQILFFTIPFHIPLKMEYFLSIIHYVIENTSINFFLILIAFLIKNYMMIFIVLISGILILLRSSLPILSYLPFVNLFITNEIHINTIVLLIISIILLYHFYIKSDLKGGKYDN